MRRFSPYGLIAAAFVVAASLAPTLRAQPAALTVETIMQDPDTWVGAWPSQPFWAEDGQTLYFYWNPQGQFESDSLFKVARQGGDPEKVAPDERRNLGPTFDGWHHGEHVYDRDFARKVYTHDGDLYLYDRSSGTETRLTQTSDRESDPRFARDGQSIVFTRGDNLYHLSLNTGAVAQLTDLRPGTEDEEQTPDEQDAFLKAQQTELFDYIRKQQEEREAREAARERDRDADHPPPTYYYGKSRVEQLQLAPGGRFVSFALTERPPDGKETKAISYVTESGYAEELTSRPKVGAPAGPFALYVQDLQRDTTYQVELKRLPGAYDVPAYLQAQGAEPDSSEAERTLFSYGPYWSGDGRYAVLDVRSRDNKTRWIVRLDPATAALTVLDRQQDDAWIAGPGISWYGGPSTIGWMPDGRHLYFQSERTGYSHLYTVDAETGTVEQLTEGEYEVFDPRLSRDGTTWYFTSSEASPYVRHFYRMPAGGGGHTKLTTMDGRNEVALSPDGKMMAVVRSYTNEPPEIYLQPPQGEPQRITHSPTSAWSAYDWRAPELTTFEASDGVDVPVQIFEPQEPNGAAVLFVHGAGYLQNVHTWWSSYFREYMFHNLLADQGYLVLNVDYRGSSGYGRDWRTAIYRHMGGRDLQDYVDASEYVGRTYDIDPERVFIYGGSYGGFLTLMALFTEPEHFGGGAALRSVTDWAHYNHGYTANILNTPATDSLAYVRSSPIYFADGLEDPLLMAHGLIDLNVEFQDIIRLTQRLIELGKKDWELAVFPVEGHGFTEPASWTDEYGRIFELIQESVGPGRDETMPPAEGGR